jgi:hypothetical protein
MFYWHQKVGLIFGRRAYRNWATYNEPCIEGSSGAYNPLVCLSCIVLASRSSFLNVEQCWYAMNSQTRPIVLYVDYEDSHLALRKMLFEAEGFEFLSPDFNICSSVLGQFGLTASNSNSAANSDSPSTCRARTGKIDIRCQ